MAKPKAQIITESELLESTAIFPSAFDTMKKMHEIKTKGGRPVIYRQGNSFWVRDDFDPAQYR